MNPKPCDDLTQQGDHAQRVSPYTDLDRDSNEIRLVEILPGEIDDPIELRLYQTRLGDGPRYSALSYVWNPLYGTRADSPDLARIKNIKGCTVSIGANLDAAIRQLRARTTERTPVWIDALCINQEDVRERGHQVGLMANIYSSAIRVIIWLGPFCDDSTFAMRSIDTGEIPGQDIPRFLYAFEMVLRRDWFGRVWIAQELTLARYDPLVLCGADTASWYKFVIWTRYLRSILYPRPRLDLLRPGNRFPMSYGYYEVTLEDKPVPPSEQDLRGAFSKDTRIALGETDWVSFFDNPTGDPFAPGSFHSLALDDRAVLRSILARTECVENLAAIRENGTVPLLVEQLQRTIYLTATDPRDKVYGLLGLSHFKHGPPIPDYTKPPTYVFSQTMADILENHLPVVFSWLKLGRSAMTDLPSWAPDLQIQALGALGSPQTLVPEAMAIQDVLNDAHCFTPVVHFSGEFKRLHTVGSILGQVTRSKRLDLGNGGDGDFEFGLSQVIRFALENNLSMRQLLRAQLGATNPFARAEDFERRLASFEWIVKKMGGPSPPFRGAHREDLSLLAALKYSSGNCIFVTDTGLVGLSGNVPETPFIEESGPCALIGLFGINFPFLIQPTVDLLYNEIHDVYRLVSVAHVVDHRWGHDFVEHAPKGIHWSELKEHGLREFTII